VVYAFKVSQNAFIRAASTVYPRIEFLCVQVYCVRVLDCRYRSLFERKNQRRLRGQAHTTSRDEIQPAEQITGAHCWFGGGEEGDHRAEPDRAVILETTTIPRGVWVLRKRTPYTRESQIKVYVGEDFFLLAVRHIPHTALPS